MAVMDVIQVRLPEQLQDVVDRQVAEGRIASRDAFLVEAARRFADEIALEDDLRAEAAAGIADVEKGRFIAVDAPADVAALHEATMARLRARLAADPG